MKTEMEGEEEGGRQPGESACSGGKASSGKIRVPRRGKVALVADCEGSKGHWSRTKGGKMASSVLCECYHRIICGTALTCRVWQLYISLFMISLCLLSS